MNIRLFYILPVILLFLFPSLLLAQFTCEDSSRYFVEVFDSVEVSSGIQYGKNGQDLLMDVYEPKGDTFAKRPLLILAFGGSFVFGNRDDDYMRELGIGFAKKGYVVASIDYRLTPSLITDASNQNFYGAVLKASHDMLASVRYFRKEFETNNNPFRIDTSLIFAGGVSAGAIAGVHAGYLRDPSEFPVELDTVGIGGVEGLSGNLGYSSEFAGIINWCGSVGDSSWINQGETKMLSMHGDNDLIVPYASGQVVIFNANLPVDGSGSMKIRTENVGIDNPFYTWAGAGHTPFLRGFSNRPAVYMDTLVTYSTGVLYQWLCDHYTWATPVDPLLAAEPEIQVYPNPVPASSDIQITWEKEVFASAELSMYNLQGQQMNVDIKETAHGFLIQRNALPQGYYILGLRDIKHARVYHRKVLLR